MKTTLIQSILAAMQDAANEITERAVSYGYAGDRSNADAVTSFLANESLDHDDYNSLHADSRTLSDGNYYLVLHGNEAEQVEAEKWAKFNYFR